MKHLFGQNSFAGHLRTDLQCETIDKGTTKGSKLMINPFSGHACWFPGTEEVKKVMRRIV